MVRLFAAESTFAYLRKAGLRALFCLSTPLPMRIPVCFRALCWVWLWLSPALLPAQSATPALYDPLADAQAGIEAAIATARDSGRHVFLQVGGNWCGWCIRFHRFCKEDPEIDSILSASYVPYHLNYSRENTNAAVLASLGYPQRFGFPVFVVLDSTGQRLHTQDSALLEDGDGYDRKKVLGFLRQWTPAALDPARYP